MTARIWTAALLVIGDEILSGRTADANIHQVARWLDQQAIRLVEVRVVADVHDRIVDAVRALKATTDYLFTTGGIGPTHDDITVDAVADALEVPVVIHPDARAMLEGYYADKGGLTDARLRMARVPDGAELIHNRLSGAPGIRLATTFILAGVPHIAAGMLEALNGQLEGGDPVLNRTLGARVPESEVANTLAAVERENPDCQIGSYPFFRQGKVGANFVVRSTDADALTACATTLAQRLAALGVETVDGGIE